MKTQFEISLIDLMIIFEKSEEGKKFYEKIKKGNENTEIVWDFYSFPSEKVIIEVNK